MVHKQDNSKTSFQAKLPMLHMMLKYLREKLEEFGFHDPELTRCEIALEEVLVNIINHAYKGEVGDIELSYRKEGQSIVITIRDKGIEFNPLAYEDEYDTSAPLESREAGGLGIKMMKEFMDSVSYTREADANILSLEKKLPRSN